MNTHIHMYKIDSDIKQGHKHKITGYAELMLGINSLHFHGFSGVSSYCNHTHYFSGITGLPIKTENGHIHKIEVILESNDIHDHKIVGLTSEEISYNSGFAKNEAFV